MGFWAIVWMLDLLFISSLNIFCCNLLLVVSSLVDGGQELGSIFSKTSMMVLGTAGRLPQSPPAETDPASQSVLLGSVLQPPAVLVASAVNFFLFASVFFRVKAVE